MADSVNEDLEYKDSGKDELDWGYEEGKLVFISMWRDAGKYVVLASLFGLTRLSPRLYTACVVCHLLTCSLFFRVLQL